MSSLSNGYLQYTQEANEDRVLFHSMDNISRQFGMSYAEFAKLRCWHDWSKPPYTEREREPFMFLTHWLRPNLAKWQCKHCNLIKWWDSEPAKDL